MRIFYDPMRPRRSPRFKQTREQLRAIAKSAGVKRGRNTMDTVNNLRAAGISIQ